MRRPSPGQNMTYSRHDEVDIKDEKEVITLNAANRPVFMRGPVPLGDKCHVRCHVIIFTNPRLRDDKFVVIM